jgi:hypothetical protein
VAEGTGDRRSRQEKRGREQGKMNGRLFVTDENVNNNTYLCNCLQSTNGFYM